MEIRSLTIDDYACVLSLWKRTPGMGLRSLDDSREGISLFLKRNPKTNFILTDGTQVAGAILCGHDGRRGYIYHAVVDEAYRRQGYGKQLVDRVLAALQEEGIKKAALVVFADNLGGNRFWEALGFTCREDLTYRNRTIDPENI